jgi:hypothetical protein
VHTRPWHRHAPQPHRHTRPRHRHTRPWHPCVPERGARERSAAQEPAFKLSVSARAACGATSAGGGCPTARAALPWLVRAIRILRHSRGHSSYWACACAASVSACLVTDLRIRARAGALCARRWHIRRMGASIPRYVLAHAPAFARASAGGTRPSLGMGPRVRGKGLRIGASSPGMRGYGSIHCASSMPECAEYRVGIPGICAPKSADAHVHGASCLRSPWGCVRASRRCINPSS